MPGCYPCLPALLTPATHDGQSTRVVVLEDDPHHIDAGHVVLLEELGVTATERTSVPGRCYRWKRCTGDRDAIRHVGEHLHREITCSCGTRTRRTLDGDEVAGAHRGVEHLLGTRAKRRACRSLPPRDKGSCE